MFRYIPHKSIFIGSGPAEVKLPSELVKCRPSLRFRVFLGRKKHDTIICYQLGEEGLRKVITLVDGKLRKTFVPLPDFHRSGLLITQLWKTVRDGQKKRRVSVKMDEVAHELLMSYPVVNYSRVLGRDVDSEIAGILVRSTDLDTIIELTLLSIMA